MKTRNGVQNEKEYTERKKIKETRGGGKMKDE